MKARWPNPLLTLIAGLALPIAAQAQIISFEMTDPLVISPDGESEIIVTSPAAPELGSVESVTVTVAHDWLGDLTMELIAPDGQKFVLFERVGVTPSDSFGSAGILGEFVPSGPTSFALAPLPYTFAQSGADFSAAAALAEIGNKNVPLVPADSVYQAQSWAAGPFPAGAWQLKVRDGVDACGGQLAAVEFLDSPVPEPADTTLVIGLALAMGAAVRHARRQLRRV